MTRDEALDRIHDPLAAPLTEDEQRAFEAWLERDDELCTLYAEQQGAGSVRVQVLASFGDGVWAIFGEKTLTTDGAHIARRAHDTSAARSTLSCFVQCTRSRELNASKNTCSSYGAE